MILKLTRMSFLALFCTTFLVQAEEAKPKKRIFLTITLEETNTPWETGKGALIGSIIGSAIGVSKNYKNQNTLTQDQMVSNVIYNAAIWGLIFAINSGLRSYGNNSRIDQGLALNAKHQAEAAALIAQEELDQASA